jgi:hypothetical protein
MEDFGACIRKQGNDEKTLLSANSCRVLYAAKPNRIRGAT